MIRVATIPSTSTTFKIGTYHYSFEVLIMTYISKHAEKYKDQLYFVFRVFVGLLFLQHGLQKLLGLFGGVGGDGVAITIFSLMGLAGVIECLAGLGIAFGFFTRLVAVVAAVEMVVAFFMAHWPQGWVPLLNKGELSLLYFAAFLILVVYGSGKWNLEKALINEEMF